jgi:putative membrane-bound dehydrogenase-like protein
MASFSTRRAAIVALAAFSATLLSSTLADEPRKQPLDITQPQSPSQPAPGWVKIVDQGAQNPVLKGYKLPQGIRVEIVAENPVTINPVGMTFSTDGTPYVLEWRAGDGGSEKMEEFVYKDGTTRSLLTMKKQIKDVVKVLRDSKNTGTYDSSTVMLEDELPSSILLHDGWLYLTGRGTVRRFKQSQSGGPYDRKEVIAQGFCAFHHHQVSGLTIGNDGWLYVTAGDNDNFVEGSDGSRATVLRTGGIFRMKPDGTQVETYSIGYRNPYRDVAFDDAANMFHADNDNEDGSKFTGCRLMHIAEGNDFGWRLRQGARCCSPDPVRAAVYGELPGKVPPLCKTGRGAPAGLLIYNDTQFPEEYRGLLLYPDVFRKLIRAYKVEQAGASFAVTEEFDFMKSDDPLFRPCQMVIGPDGAIYVVDWRTDSGGAGRLSGDGVHGRIYRLTWSGTAEEPALPRRPMDSWSKLPKLEDAELVKTLESPSASDRYYAREELRRRGAGNRPALLKLLQNGDAPLTSRIAALGILESFWNEEVAAAFAVVLHTGDADLRRLAADGVGRNSKHGDADAQNHLLKQLSDDDLSVRRAVAMAIGRIAAPGAGEILTNALAFDDGQDVYLRDGLIRALESLGKSGMDALLTLAESGDPKKLDKAIAAFVAFRSRPAAAALARLLSNPHLKASQRAELVRSCSNYLLEPPVSLEAIYDYLLGPHSPSEEVKLAALEMYSSSGFAQSDKASIWLLRMLNDGESRVQLAAIRALQNSRVSGTGQRLLDLLQSSEQSSSVRQEVLKALRQQGDKAAATPLKALLAGPEEPSPLKIEALRTLASLDAAEAALAARPLLHSPNAALQTEAVVTVGADAAGAKLAASQLLEKKLPSDLLPQVSAALRKHVDKDSEAAQLLTDVMKHGLSVANNPEEVARIRKLVARKGNPQRGKTIYLNSKTVACVSCHRMEGVGGNVGPDLTRLWDTQSVEKIIESILEPSKEIKEGYQTFVATTHKGQVFSGLKVTQTRDEVVLRDATGKDIHLSMKDVAELAPSKLSLMPDNVISQLSYDQFIDLVAFLKDRKAQESLRELAKEQVTPK